MVWHTSKLGDVCEMIKRGIGPKYAENDGVCVINQKCIRDHSVNYDLARQHNSELKKVSEDRYIKAGDVLVNSTGTGTLGRVAQIRVAPDEPVTVDTHVTIVRPKKGLFYSDFFGYMLIKIEEEIAAAGEGTSGQTELARTKLENEFFVSYPDSVSEQKHIVAILDQAFADIDKARALTEQNLKNARELFESYLQQVFSQRGEGWEEERMSEVCEGNITDGTHQTPKYFDEGYIFLSSKNVTSGVIDWENVRYIDESQHVEMQKRLSPRLNDILLAKNGTTGVAAIVDKEEVFDIYVSLALLRPSEKIEPRYLLHYVNSSHAKEQFNKRLKGIGVPNLHLKEIRDVVVSYPSSRKEQKKIIKQVDDLLSYRNALEVIYQEKLKAIDELKKSILQKAFSGELTRDSEEAAA